MATIEWIECKECGTEREIAELLNGCCAFCGTQLTNLPTEPLPERLSVPKIVKPRAPKRKVKLEPVPDEPPSAVFKPLTADQRIEAEEEAFRMPYDRPIATIDPNIDKELASRVLCRRKLLPFIQRFRPKYKAGWVHKDICRRLEKFVKDVEDGKEPRLLLMMPPRSGKSEIGSRHLPPWVLGKHPDWEIIAGSHTSSLTMSFSRYVRDLIRDPAYLAIFPEGVLDPGSQSVENWNIMGGGGYLAAGVGTGITGRGAHILLLDDLVKDMEAADSPTIRENTWEWYCSTAYTRLAPGGGVLGIMTWWNEDDWAGRIQQVMATGEGDKFEIIKYPALNEEGDEYMMMDEPGEPIRQIVPPQPVPKNAVLTRLKNTAIHPERYTTDAMLRIKANLKAAGQLRVWQALYQQNPTPDSGIHFTKEMFRYYGSRPALQDMYIYQAWDFAITESEQNDFIVGVTIAVDHRDWAYVLDMVRYKSADGILIAETVVDYAKEWKVTAIGVEDGQIWKSIKTSFDKYCDTLHYWPVFEVLVPLTDKMVRAGPLKGRMQAHKVLFDADAPYFPVMQKELLFFPAGKHDDIVDALAWAIRLLLTRSAPRQQVPKKLKSWKDKLAQYTGGGVGGSHMAA